MNKELNGRVALVTGAGRGIGRSCVLAFASLGAKVIAVARSQNELNEVRRHFPENIQTWTLDVTEDDIIEKIAKLERLDIVVNNAGGNHPAPFLEVTLDSLDFIVDLNIKSVFRISQAATKNMRKNAVKGSIIQMSSQMAHVGSPNRSVYCMTKHAIEGLTKSMAVELAPEGIRVNSVAPTFVETPLTKPMLEDKEFKNFVMSMIPMQQLATVDDVVNSVVFLASSKSSMITGHSLRVDGGWTAQ